MYYQNVCVTKSVCFQASGAEERIVVHNEINQYMAYNSESEYVTDY